MWETVAQAVINGLLIGGIYALVSIGVTLIFGVVKIVNFAQGEFVMIGMYISFFLANQFGIDPLLSLFVSMPVLFVIGVLVQHFLIRRVLGPNDMPQIFLTFALSLLLLNLALMLFSANYRTVHTSYSDEAFHIGGLYIPVAKLIAFVVAMVLSGALWVFLHTTDLGKAMRAAAQNRDVATLMGINPNRVFCVALGIALALAGAAGSLLMPFYSAYPFVGQVFVLMAFVAVVLGTLGNVIGALVASLMMGVAESLGIQFVGADSGLIVVFAMLLLTLAFKPTGLGGGRCAMTGRTQGLLGLAIGIAVVIALPLVVKSSFAIDIFIRILLFSFIGVAWNLMGGYAKQLSLGHAAYFGLGAYTSTILQIDFGISPWIGMIAGGLVAMLASLPIGWLCFRLRGPYFTIATIATAQALMLIFLKFRDLAWGAEGTTIPNLGSAPLMMQFETKSAYYYVALGLLALGLAITYLIERSWMGYYLVAIGEDEDAAEAIGVNAPRIKRDIYLISSFLTALAGTFYTQYIYFIDPATAFSFNISIEAALVSIVGGIGTLWGPVIGTILLETTSTLLQSWLGGSIGGVQLTVYSLILMAVILWRPTGLMGMMREAWQRFASRKPARA
jgi:branched-chain amino acid transport system permease protein